MSPYEIGKRALPGVSLRLPLLRDMPPEDINQRYANTLVALHQEDQPGVYAVTGWEEGVRICDWRAWVLGSPPQFVGTMSRTLFSQTVEIARIPASWYLLANGLYVYVSPRQTRQYHRGVCDATYTVVIPMCQETTNRQGSTEILAQVMEQVFFKGIIRAFTINGQYAIVPVPGSKRAKEVIFHGFTAIGYTEKDSHSVRILEPHMEEEIRHMKGDTVRVLPHDPDIPYSPAYSNFFADESGNKKQPIPKNKYRALFDGPLPPPENRLPNVAELLVALNVAREEPNAPPAPNQIRRGARIDNWEEWPEEELEVQPIPGEEDDNQI